MKFDRARRPDASVSDSLALFGLDRADDFRWGCLAWAVAVLRSVCEHNVTREYGKQPFTVIAIVTTCHNTRCGKLMLKGSLWKQKASVGFVA